MPRAVTQKCSGLLLLTFEDKSGRKVAVAALAVRSPYKAGDTHCFVFIGETQRFAFGGGSPEGREGAAVPGGGHVGRGLLGG